MCILCNQARPRHPYFSRRNFLTGAAATAAAVSATSLFAPRPAAAQTAPPPDTGRPGRRYVIRNGAVMSMDAQVGDFARADVLINGNKIQAIGPDLSVGNADVVDAGGLIVMPGFIDTHHHQAWTAIRSSIPDSILINDGTGTPSAQQNYFVNVLGGFQPPPTGFARHFRPQDVYVSELFGGLSQLDNGVTTVLDISQIHHSPQHSDAAVKALRDAGRRGVLGYFESAGPVPGNQYPQDAFRIKQQWFSSNDQLTTMIMGGEVYLGLDVYSQSWAIGRQLGLQIAAHILSPFGIRPILDDLASRPASDPLSIRSDNLFIHMTGMSDAAWNKVKQVGAQVSIAFPIEMNMRHGVPPIIKMQDLGMEPSLSSDVETNMTACFFTQMRSAMTLQRVIVNQKVLDQGLPPNPLNPWPSFPANTPPLLNVRDVLRYATINGAKHLRLDGKTGSLKPGKEADIILLDATHLNVFPVNHVPGAVVQMMDRSNVETVIVAGKIRKWQGKLLDVNLDSLRSQLAASRDFIYQQAGVPQNLFR